MILGRLHTFDAFTSRNFRFLWTAHAIFSAAFWLHFVVVGWLSYEISESPLISALVLGIDALPVLIGAPFGGLLSDKYNKKILLTLTYCYLFIVLSCYSVVILYGFAETWNVLLFVFLVGMSWIVIDPARMALIASVSLRSNLQNAFSLDWLGFSLMRLITPASGGLAIAIWGPGPIFVVCSLLMGSAAIFISLVERDSDVASRNIERPVGTVMGDLKSGISQLTVNNLTVGITLISLILILFTIPFVGGLAPVYAKEIYNVGPEGLGLMMSSAGLGSVIGTFILATSGEIRKPGKILILLVICLLVLMVLLGINDNFFLSLAIFFCSSACTFPFLSISSSTIQSVIPANYRGRVNGIYTSTWGIMPVGSLMSGLLADRYGVQVSTIFGALIAFIWLMTGIRFFKQMWNNQLDSDRE